MSRSQLMRTGAELLSLIRESAASTGFSGVVRVDLADEPLVSEAFGLADRRHEIPNTTNTRFGSASGTKGLTALTVMSLVDDGTLSLATTARSVLGPDLPLIDDAVTVHDLLAHRSGIGDYVDEEQLGDVNDYVMTVPVHELSSTEAYLAVLDGYPQREPPGETCRYNNGGYVVLALLAERAAGVPFHRLVDERVVRPAGMSATGFVRSDELTHDSAVGYLDEAGLRSNVLHLPVLGSGDGGIYTRAGDLHRLWTAFFGDRIVTAPSRARMLAPPTDQLDQHDRHDQHYGLGFLLHDAPRRVSLEGMDAGTSFRSVHDPAQRLTHTTIANTSDGAWAMTRLLDDALGFG